tara:strand:- start:419 stop:724 length:306 start_codon:yes stop_codon:yes gene_type:complete
MQNDLCLKKNNMKGTIVIMILHKVNKDELFPNMIVFDIVIICIKEKIMSVCSVLFLKDKNTKTILRAVFTNGSKVIIRNINKINSVYLILIFGIECIKIYS